MMLFWKIRYLDRADKQFKDRHLSLDTDTLDVVTHAAIELVVENRSMMDRTILKHRHLFVEGTLESVTRAMTYSSKFVFVPEYFEDDTGKEISDNEIAQILTGSPTARVIPRGAKQHDIDFMLAEPTPIPLAEVSLSPVEIRLLGYFRRDLREMLTSAFMKDGPGTLVSGVVPDVRTAVSDDEIRSFVTIFRRLYMTGSHDPASLSKIIPIFAQALGNHPFSKWVQGIFAEYQNHLALVPDCRPMVTPGTYTFKTKRLIDVFLYTQYAHQPNEDRQRQFEACLAEVGGRRAVLTWMFLTEMWKCALEIGNAGRNIVWWFQHYCDHHGISPDVLDSLRDHHSGLGADEKEEDRKKRLFEAKAEQLAADLWAKAGRPNGGPSLFLASARAQLTSALQTKTS